MSWWHRFVARHCCCFSLLFVGALRKSCWCEDEVAPKGGWLSQLIEILRSWNLQNTWTPNFLRRSLLDDHLTPLVPNDNWNYSLPRVLAFDDDATSFGSVLGGHHRVGRGPQPGQTLHTTVAQRLAQPLHGTGRRQRPRVGGPQWPGLHDVRRRPWLDIRNIGGERRGRRKLPAKPPRQALPLPSVGAVGRQTHQRHLVLGLHRGGLGRHARGRRASRGRRWTGYV
jgi:hypothetical protein